MSLAPHLAPPVATHDPHDPDDPVRALRGRRVLLISPQAWNGLKLSKHHYALELARRGSEVFFLNPPSGTGVRPRVSQGPCPNLWIVDYSQISRGRRFLPAAVNDAIESIQAGIVQRALKAPVDVVWSFDPARFTVLTEFDAQLHFFHAADRVEPEAVRRIGASAVAVISVSDLILADFAPTGIPRFFVNHGLAEEYAGLAREQLARLSDGPECRASPPQKVGYVGNLLRPDIDHAAFSRIVQENADIQFHLWGPHEYSALDWEHQGVPEVTEFISFLGQRTNVVMHGLKTPAEVAAALFGMDMLLTCYDPLREMNRASNNHKVLEYLSTGKPVVTNHVSTYVRRGIPEGLLCMPDTLDNSGLPALFRRTVETLAEWSTAEKQKERIRFALANTYADQLRIIDSIAVKLLR